jgi:hypothetical protein
MGQEVVKSSIFLRLLLFLFFSEWQMTAKIKANNEK